MTRSLALVLLCAASGAHAGTWSVAIDAGSSELDSRHHDDADVDSDLVFGLRAGWWFNQYLGLEAGWQHADTAYRIDAGEFEREYDAVLVGVRVAVPLGERFFALAKGGFAWNLIDTEEPRGRVPGAEIVEDDSETGHYLGAGVGWRWSKRWSSTLEFTRVYGDVAYGCDPGICRTTHSSYFDSVTFGVAYAFE